ncbi:hypothetical protein [Nostoc sp. 'Peltigera malacea cyanobiont' DB3992]|uniref:hypothetical protein n=1 Tax=Nostoc sp. 'Peltigera malacea cyanobiont' DB3992 TaxID=1206980 RepID=UPI000C0399F4|nr:hypothetical protein [Nostoc sp. 'Peltigera malacea cyanobiont' DB3992]PHM08012.1 hypothetical protein CK516_23410 [Nostoc sp. 'Peltigera malacea cyanobiont' DB3992]
MLLKFVEGMLSHPWQLKIHSVYQKVLRYLWCYRRHRSSEEMGNTIKELLSTLTIDERLGVMLEFENLNMTRQMLITFGCGQK